VKSRTWDDYLLTGVNLLILFFLVAPIFIVVVQAFNSGLFLQFPIQGVSTRWFVKFFTTRAFMEALATSLKLAAWTVALATILGTMAALVLARVRFRASDLLNSLLLSPLMLPGILTGLALFQFYIVIGWGRTFTGLVLAHTVITMPYVMRTVTALLNTFDRSIEEAARNLGANEWRTFAEVTLPMIKPGVIAGAVFAFIVSFDQFPVSLFLVQPGTMTLPIEIFNYLKYDFDPAVAAAASISVALTVAVVLIVDRLIGLHRFARL
jgi:putative spermidine/putrescine transport system permease protein